MAFEQWCYLQMLLLLLLLLLLQLHLILIGVKQYLGFLDASPIPYLLNFPHFSHPFAKGKIFQVCFLKISNCRTRVLLLVHFGEIKVRLIRGFRE